jgi:hypothetical protein
MSRPGAASCSSTILFRSAEKLSSVAVCESQTDGHRKSKSGAINASYTKALIPGVLKKNRLQMILRFDGKIFGPAISEAASPTAAVPARP